MDERSSAITIVPEVPKIVLWYVYVPGTYHYHSTIFGTTGTIVVADERSSTP